MKYQKFIPCFIFLILIAALNISCVFKFDTAEYIKNTLEQKFDDSFTFIKSEDPEYISSDILYYYKSEKLDKEIIVKVYTWTALLTTKTEYSTNYLGYKFEKDIIEYAENLLKKSTKVTRQDYAIKFDPSTFYVLLDEDISDFDSFCNSIKNVSDYYQDDYFEYNICVKCLGGANEDENNRAYYEELSEIFDKEPALIYYDFNFGFYEELDDMESVDITSIDYGKYRCCEANIRRYEDSVSGYFSYIKN